MKLNISMSARRAQPAKRLPPAKAPVKLPDPVEKVVLKIKDPEDPDVAKYARDYAEWKVAGEKGHSPDSFINYGPQRRIRNSIDLAFSRIEHLKNIGQDIAQEIQPSDVTAALKPFVADMKALGFEEVQVSKYARRDKERNIAEIWLVLDAEHMKSGKGTFKWHAFENIITDGGWKEAHGMAIGFGLLSSNFYTKKISIYNYIIRIAGSPVTFREYDDKAGALKIWLKMPTYANS